MPLGIIGGVNKDLRIARLAEAQHGVLTRRQAEKNGFTASACERRLAAGRWVPVHRGVYRLAGSPETWEQRVMAACLALPGCVASHIVAGVLWRFPGCSRQAEITLTGARQTTLPKVRVRRTRCLDPVDRARCANIPATSVARTVIDLSTELPESRLATVVDFVLANRMLPVSYLAGRLEALGVQGRRGAGCLRDLLEERSGRARQVDSEFQRRLGLLIAQRGLASARFEYPTRLAGGKVRFADVAFVEERVAFEADSYRHHSSLTDWAADHTRNNLIMAEGWTVLPITWDQIENDPRGAVDLMVKVVSSHRLPAPGDPRGVYRSGITPL